MANLTQLKGQIKTLNDFTKVVNIQKIVIMKEIAHWQKVIEKAIITRAVFIELIKRINKKYHSISKNIFENKKMGKEVPLKRNLHFIFQGNVQDSLTSYEFKIIEEFCRKNHGPKDIYTIIGRDLSTYLKSKGFNVTTTIEVSDVDDLSIYKRISHLIYEGFNELMYVQATLGFLDVSTRKFFNTKIFPFPKKHTHESNITEKSNDFSPILKMKLGRVEWIKNFSIVTNDLIKNAIESSIYLNVVEYSLAMKRRELQALDDKEKNILEEIEQVKLKIQRVRKDMVTNELLTNATAFEALAEEEGQ